MIVSLEDAALLTGGNDADPKFRRIVFAVNKEIERVCGRLFTKASRTEVVRGYGQPSIFLRESPIISISEVRIDACGEFGDDTIIDPLRFMWVAGDPEDSRLFYLDGCFPESQTAAKVTYVGGYDPPPATSEPTLFTMPEDLRSIVLDEINARVSRGTSEAMKSETMGSYSYTRFDANEGPVARVLARYRR